jgi:hypothetical protein
MTEALHVVSCVSGAILSLRVFRNTSPACARLRGIEFSPADKVIGPELDMLRSHSRGAFRIVKPSILISTDPDFTAHRSGGSRRGDPRARQGCWRNHFTESGSDSTSGKEKVWRSAEAQPGPSTSTYEHALGSGSIKLEVSLCETPITLHLLQRSMPENSRLPTMKVDRPFGPLHSLGLWLSLEVMPCQSVIMVPTGKDSAGGIRTSFAA